MVRSDSTSGLGDRRTEIRLEVVGVLWGTVETMARAELVNISSAGALLRASLPLALHSSHSMILGVDQSEVTVEARVRHIEVVRSPETPTAYSMGVEFLYPTVALSRLVATMIATKVEDT